MTIFRVLAVSAALAALAATGADAQTRTVGGGQRITIPSHSNHFSWERGHGGFHGFGGWVWVIERPFGYAQDREVPPLDYARDERKKEETPPPPAAVPLPEQAQGGAKERKPYVIGSTYASLPSGCMKLVELAASYYFCGGGEWYRQEGKRYRAVKRQL